MNFYKMKGNTKLKVAIEEIKDILKKHDIAGSVALHTDGHGEFMIYLNTSYSCAYHIEDNSIHLYSKKDDKSTPEERTEKQRQTSNMLRILTECTGINFCNLETVSRELDNLIGAEHTDPNIS